MFSFCQPTSQRYCSLILNQYQPPATSQLAILLSHNKSAPAISRSQANTAEEIGFHARSSFYTRTYALDTTKFCIRR